ncbi:MAG: hypothetical protein ABSB59_33300 [Streptosporangiaceae bacterium]|jgi:hypothetical protein
MRLSWHVPLAMLLGGAVLAGCAGHPATSSSSAVTASATAAGSPSSAAAPTRTPTPTRSAAPQASPTTALPVAPGAGARPQTEARPRTDTAAFRDAMADLWLAVTTGNPRFGRPAFFPEAAYRQVKAIPYPDSDWQYRLWYDFTLDVSAAHRLTGGDARLVKIVVPASYEAWVTPGACYNSIGYWHAPGARVVYREHGKERSFGIASLISWRGVWYVVHLGAVSRTVVTGIVDQPAAGPGIPGPPGGC